MAAIWDWGGGGSILHHVPSDYFTYLLQYPRILSAFVKVLSAVTGWSFTSPDHIGSLPT